MFNNWRDESLASSGGLWVLSQVVKKLIEMRQQEVQKVHPGLTCFREGVRGIPVESIPGIRETGWRPVARATRVARITEECNDPDTLLATLKNVLTTVSLEPSKLLTL